MKSKLALSIASCVLCLLAYPAPAFCQDFAAEADQNMAAGRYTLAALGYRKVFEITHDTAYLRKSAIAYMMLGPIGRDAAIAELRQSMQLAATLADAQESEVLLRKAEAMPAAPAGAPPVPVPLPVPAPGAAPTPAPAPAPAPYPAPYAPPGAQPPNGGARTTTDANVNIDGQGPRGNYVQTQDCATNPSQEICQRTTSVDASLSGVHAGLHQESVSAVKTPPSAVFGLTINGNFLYGTSTKQTAGMSINIIGGGAQLGMRLQVGLNPFPGGEGGTWGGFVLQPTAAFQGAGMTFSGGGQSSGAGITLLDLGGNAGFQFLSFGSLDTTTLKQKGFGLFGGYHAAYSQSTTYIMNTSTSSEAFSQGPVLELLFPDYNAGTAHVQSGYLEFMVLPIKDFIYLTVSGGYQF